MPFQFSIAIPPVYDQRLFQAIGNLGLTSGLKVSLDASDAASVASGTQTKWLDTSGGGYDFFRGANGSATTDDPTFNGNVGGRSLNEYWSVDGADFFRYDTTLETWMDNLHKDSAKFSWAAWIHLASLGASDNAIFGTMGTAVGTTGVELDVNQFGRQNLTIRAAGSSVVSNIASPALVTAGAWNFIGGSFDEATLTFKSRTNGTSYSVVAVQPNPPSASAASYTMDIGSAGNGTFLMTNGSRMACIAIWEGVVLTTDQLAAIHEATRQKFLV
jgi:hypothetical protein